ncbi:MAG: HEAT repeat domain-containing protein [Planctomycetota bacterium]|nr:HEAT repeat domain-containing protein [Planctomycetota bacterium]
MWQYRKRLIVLLVIAGLLAVVVIVARMDDSTGSMIEQARSAEKTRERLDAIDRLGRTGSDEAYEALASLAGDPEPEVAAHAVQAIGRRGEPRNVPTLKKVVAKDTRPRVREAGIVALGRMGMRTDPEVLAKAVTDDASPRVRATAAKWIGMLRYWQGMPALIQGLGDPSLRVRQSAYVAVRRLWERDFLYRADDPPEKREQRLRLIEASWEDYRSSQHYDVFKWPEEDLP